MSHGGDGGDRVFVDTNVLVYASRSTAPAYAAASAALLRLEGEGAELCISRQVLREYLVVTTRPPSQAGAAATALLALGVAVADARRLMDIYTVLEDGSAVTEHLLRLIVQHPTRGKQVHDANLVATMLVHGVTRLLTFNTADFRRFGQAVALEPMGTP